MALQLDGDNYEWLRTKESRLYWSKILQMIADDICDIDMGKDYYIDRESINVELELSSLPLGVVLFDTEKHARQAREIMGDKINYLL